MRVAGKAKSSQEHRNRAERAVFLSCCNSQAVLFCVLFVPPADEAWSLMSSKFTTSAKQTLAQQGFQDVPGKPWNKSGLGLGHTTRRCLPADVQAMRKTEHGPVGR